jgi:hypothetical protein
MRQPLTFASDLDLSRAVIIDLPTVIKAIPATDGRRLVEVQASCEACDLEGDVILQSALVDSAASFCASGHLDLEHFSEIGHRIGIRDPSSFIVGRPVEVKDIGQGRTSVIGEIFRSRDGHNPAKNRFDAFWDTLTSSPPIQWLSSVYGFPRSDAVADCRSEVCPSGATRFEIKAMDWRSLAFTRTPVNNALTGHAHIITAKARIAELLLAKNFNESTGMPAGVFSAMALSDDDLTLPPETSPPVTSPPSAPGTPPQIPPSYGTPAAPTLHAPRTIADALGQYHHHMRRDCLHCGGLRTIAGFRQHFVACCGMDGDAADLHAHALMYHLLLDRRRS